MKTKKRVLPTLIFSLFAATAAGSASAQQFSQTVVFGDSLSDAGNDALVPAIGSNPAQVMDYGQTGRVMLTTLTRELFIPRFQERDEGEREKPSAKYPWDGVSGVKPYRGFASSTTVGVY